MVFLKFNIKREEAIFLYLLGHAFHNPLQNNCVIHEKKIVLGATGSRHGDEIEIGIFVIFAFLTKIHNFQ